MEGTTGRFTISSERTNEKITGREWLYAFVLPLPGLFIAWLIWSPDADGTTKFFVGVLVGMTIASFVAGTFAYFHQRSTEQAPTRSSTGKG